jgi:vitamin B12 transporter
MRKKLLAIIAFTSYAASAQDSLQTTTLNEVVVTGTKFDLPVEKSGKTIFKITAEDLANNAGKSVGDVLNEVPGLQTDGNFGTPGSNVSYYLRGGRNKQTLILIDGVPLNDPSSINAEYDLRFIPVSQIESIEVLKGGLSTLYGTSAAAGVINIKLKDPTEKFEGVIDVSAASFKTFSQNLQLSGTSGKLSYLISGNNVTSEGFSSAQDNNETVVFDKDGFSRQNGLLKLGYKASGKFSIGFQSAYETFDADYDDYEFADGNNTQTFQQVRLGLTPQYKYARGEWQAKVFYNINDREFKSDYPSEANGKNLQTELIQRHRFSDVVQTVAGINFQRLAYDAKDLFSTQRGSFTLLDPYASLLVDLPVGLTVHAGLRLNTHSEYGSKVLYNLNPSYVFNKDGNWKYKLITSVATSYITPSLYQLFSEYGNLDLKPEESTNYEGGISIYNSKLTFSTVWFLRDERNPIDFVASFDDEGNYTGARYENLTNERDVKGWEFNLEYTFASWMSVGANFTTMDTDRPASFYRIPKRKYGANLTLKPIPSLNVSLKYNYTGDRTTVYYEVPGVITLDSYELVDAFASYSLLQNKFVIYGAVNNIFDKKFTAVYGYTTRGRNASVGVRYNF